MANIKHRSAAQLLQLVLDELINQDHTNVAYSGICKVIERLFKRRVITRSEEASLDHYVYENAPKNNRWTIRGLDVYKDVWGSWYWKPFATTHRINWLKKHIEKSKLNA